MPASDTALFEMIGAGDEDALGLWVAASAPDSGLSFGVEANGGPPPEVPVYRAHLPADLSIADQALGTQEERIRVSDQALDGVPERLDAFIERQLAPSPLAGSKTVDFGVGEASAETGPEADLLGLVGEAQAAGAVGPAGIVDFGIVDEALSPAMAEAREKFNELLAQINREVLHFAWVETDAGEDALARSTVDWSGDTVTVWTDEIAADQVALHSRTLRFAVASRALKIRMAFVIASGAAKLTILLSTPGAQALALPMAYRFVTKVLAQVREYQALTNP